MKSLKEELTTAMHGEFTLTPATEQKQSAFAAFDLMVRGYAQQDALALMQLTLDEARPHLPRYNQLSTKQVVLE